MLDLVQQAWGVGDLWQAAVLVAVFAATAGTWLFWNQLETQLYFAGKKTKKHTSPIMTPDGIVPRHIGVIMDGNRRYGAQKYSDRFRGHRDGADKLIEFLRWSKDTGVQCVTAYVFSTENFKRSSEEVSGLFRLLEDRISSGEFEKEIEGCRLRLLSSCPERLPASTLRALRGVEQRTCDSAPRDAFTLAVCVGYGAWSEVTGACRKIAEEVEGGDLKAKDVSEECLRSHLLSGDLPPIDLVIRTGGTPRLSNFMLLQSAYAEICFCAKMWPDFESEDFSAAIADYAKSERRFGK